jgi:hypothetical protein
MRTISLSLLFFYCLALTGCTTYHLSTQSLVEQFANTGTEKKKIYLPIYPYAFFVDPVMGNDLKALKCLDEKGREKIISVDNHTSIRITKADSSRTTFYFNTLLLKDSTITGSKTHFFVAHIKPISLRDVTRIEVQRH